MYLNLFIYYINIGSKASTKYQQVSIIIIIINI